MGRLRMAAWTKGGGAVKVISEDHTIELTRRNLLSLLAKLDGNPRDSACMIGSPNRDHEGHVWWVKAVENDKHYSDRSPGRMHDATEAALTVIGTGGCDASGVAQPTTGAGPG